MKATFTPLFAAAALLAASSVNAQIFSDTFDTDTSGDYAIVTGDADITTGTPNPIIQLFGFDYGSGTNITAFGGSAIPEAPNSPTADSLGLLTQCNALGGGLYDTSAPNGDTDNFGTQAIYPDLPSAVTGDYFLEVDAYYRPTEGSGTTEQIMLGIHVPDKATLNNLFQDGSGSGATTATAGYFFQIAGEYGFGSFDINFYEGDPGAADAAIPVGADFNFFDNTDTSGESITGQTAAFEALFPSPFGDLSTFGGPSDAWATWRISSVGGVVSVLVDTHLGNGYQSILTYDDPDDTYSDGFPHIGHEDSFGSSNPDGAILWDNLVVDAVPTDVTDWAVF